VVARRKNGRDRDELFAVKEAEGLVPRPPDGRLPFGGSFGNLGSQRREKEPGLSFEREQAHVSKYPPIALRQWTRGDFGVTGEHASLCTTTFGRACRWASGRAPATPFICTRRSLERFGWR